MHPLLPLILWLSALLGFAGANQQPPPAPPEGCEADCGDWKGGIDPNGWRGGIDPNG